MLSIFCANIDIVLRQRAGEREMGGLRGAAGACLSLCRVMLI